MIPTQGQMRYLPRMADAPKSTPAMTVEEFMDLNPGGDELWQLVDGEPRAMVQSSVAHGMLLAEVSSVIGNHLYAAGSSRYPELLVGVVPHVNARHNIRVPDLSIAHGASDEEERWLDAPVLVVELLTPENHAETWENIWACTSIPSVEEMLVLHVKQVGADLLRRDADGRWPRDLERLTGGDLVLHSVGLRIPLADLYRTIRLHSSARL